MTRKGLFPVLRESNFHGYLSARLLPKYCCYAIFILLEQWRRLQIKIVEEHSFPAERSSSKLNTAALISEIFYPASECARTAFSLIIGFQSQL